MSRRRSSSIGALALALALTLTLVPGTPWNPAGTASAAGSVPVRVAAPAFPLPGALVDSSTWDDDEFYETWLPRRIRTRIAHRIWPERSVVFGLRPHSISARFEEAAIRSVTLLFLDSGTHFGYVPRDLAARTERDHREAFHRVYLDTLTTVRGGLQKLAGGPGRSLALGKDEMLRQQVEIFETGDLVARLHAIEDQLVKITLFHGADQAESWLSPDRKASEVRDWAASLRTKVSTLDNGDHLLNEVPMFPQGDRAYCGVSALTMAMQYLGLNIDTEDYAAAAGIRYGSTRGSKIREIYSAAADELGFDMRRTTKFDFGRTRSAIDAGLPVVVWRRWSQQRDYLHGQFARRFAKDPNLTLPPADSNDRALWPDEDAYNHASVITGYNDERGEVIFTESWSEGARNRRMRIAEMDGTCYYAFFFSP